MISYTAPTIKSGSLTIKGGWTVKVPTISVGVAEEEIYVKYLVSRGMSVPMARKQVKESFQAVFARAWFHGLRKMLFKRAREYDGMFPDLKNLKGFDPEKLQAAYMPGEKPGRNGKVFVRQMLVEMGLKAGGR